MSERDKFQGAFYMAHFDSAWLMDWKAARGGQKAGAVIHAIEAPHMGPQNRLAFSLAHQL